MGRIILVTGVSNDLGGRFARRIASDPEVDRVIGVDVVPPRRDLGAVRFVRADIRNPVIAKVIAGEDVDTVVHTSVVASAGQLGGRTSMKEHNVIGTMQLLAACQRAPGLERLVVKSSAEVYGASNRDPAMFTEEMSARRQPRGGYGKDVLEVEGYVRGFSRRRPDMTVTLLRNATTLSSYTRSPLADYFRLSPVPKVLGYDARVQLLHYDDLVAVLHHAALAGVHGTFNVAGDGVLAMSQAIRKLGRGMVPVPALAMATAGTLVRQARLGLSGFSSEQLQLLTYGRGLDTTRMRAVLGFEPRYTTEQALTEFATSLPRPLATHPVLAADQLLSGALGSPHG
ncbi:NAD-dependent epimerase/dehydratase family protein [Nocardioides caldifontis]|uniref:NAD-dependent epimerase/dehydratase family protein n=1 Tax=Nocardioides caldifontis TaxID=2588938 RepID=UPI0011E05FA6|nr:NAD-dependent epimerase/dehydratase family protein [Nocardioides caldifontis]